jgi:hypothetical protein
VTLAPSLPRSSPPGQPAGTGASPTRVAVRRPLRCGVASMAARHRGRRWQGRLRPDRQHRCPVSGGAARRRDTRGRRGERLQPVYSEPVVGGGVEGAAIRVGGQGQDVLGKPGIGADPVVAASVVRRTPYPSVPVPAPSPARCTPRQRCRPRLGRPSAMAEGRARSTCSTIGRPMEPGRCSRTRHPWGVP